MKKTLYLIIALIIITFLNLAGAQDVLTNPSSALEMNPSSSLALNPSSTLVFPIVPAVPAQVEASQIAFDEVTVEYYGSWQWGVDKYHTYKMVREGTNYSLNEEFGLDLDDADERVIVLDHAFHKYYISMERSPSGGTDVIIQGGKDGKPCASNNGKVLKTLNRVSNIEVNDFVQACGFSLQANWETLAIETDVSIEKISFMESEIQKNTKEALDYVRKNNLTALLNSVGNAKENFRVVELKNPNDIIPEAQQGAYKLYSKPIGLNEEAAGKENGVVISNNSKILYVVFLKKQFTNAFYVAKPTTEKKITDYKSWSELKQDAILNWQQLPEQKLSTMQEVENWIEKGALATTVPGAAVGTAYSIGAGSVWAWSAASNLAISSSALAAGTGSAIMSASSTTAGAAGLVPGVAGGTMTGGGSLIAISITPVGWVLLGAAAVAGTGYAVYHFTDTDNFGYDNGGLMLNIDPEFFSRNEAKIDFMLIRDPDFKPPVQQLGAGVIKINFVKLDKLKEKTIKYNNGQGYGMQEIFNGAYITDSQGTKLDNITATKKLEGNAVTFSGFERGKTYQLWVKFEKFKPLKYSDITPTEDAFK